MSGDLKLNVNVVCRRCYNEGQGTVEFSLTEIKGVGSGTIRARVGEVEVDLPEGWERRSSYLSDSYEILCAGCVADR